MTYLLYISDSATPEQEPFLISVIYSIDNADRIIDHLKNQAIERFTWVAEPVFTLRETTFNELLK